MDKAEEKIPVGVPQQILEKFLKNLESTGVPADIIERLQKSIENGEISEIKLSKALLSDDPQL